MSEISAGDLIDSRAMWPDDFHDCVPRIAEVAPLDLKVPSDIRERVVAAAGDLLVDPSLLDDCVAALVAGHVVLQGPPGTGKSTLARALAAAFNVDLLPVTAHEDWSTFEVIGRQELRVRDSGAEEIVAVNGHFTEAVIRCAGRIPLHADDPANPQATWLLIDELNRAHPDKAFGELFSALGADQPVDVMLGYQKAGNDSLVVPRRFRIIATVNSVDKQFVNALSQGLRRRFTFLTYDIPPTRSAGETWGSDGSQAVREFSVVTQLACARASRRLSQEVPDLEGFISDAAVHPLVEALFDVVERVRYATEEADDPFIPIGTAPMIDTVELFLTRASLDSFGVGGAGAALDWATSVKLAPLFEAGSINRDKLAHLAESLPSPFDSLTRRVVLEIAADGLYYVS